MTYNSIVGKTIVTFAAMGLLSIFANMSVPTNHVYAAGGAAPQPSSPSQRCSRYKRNSSKWKRCMRRQSFRYGTEDIYYAGYWLGEAGDYEAAIDVLKRAEPTTDPRILTYIGYSTRKLGNVDGGIIYYKRALAADPNYSNAREYLGEGYLQKGDLAAAEGQLKELALRCGKACEQYTTLESKIGQYKAKAEEL